MILEVGLDFRSWSLSVQEVAESEGCLNFKAKSGS